MGGISTVLFFMIFCLSGPVLAQHVQLKGIIKDIHSDEPIPFATVQFKKTKFAKVSDSAGNFSFTLAKWPTDTLVITYAGFEDKIIVLDTSLAIISLEIPMERGRKTNEVIVKGKINRGLLIWKRIVKNKPRNDRTRFTNFSYELYNKLEVDLNKVNKENMQKGIPLNLLSFTGKY
jgi:hypothetical protein